MHGWHRHVIDKPGLPRSDLLKLFYVADGIVGHRRFQVPAGIVSEGVNRRCVAEEVRFPLARVAAHEAVEIIEAHPVWPLIEWSGLARLEEGRVVVLTEPRSFIAVVL